MNNQGKKASIQTLAAGFLGFAGIVGVGSLVTLHHGGSAKVPASVYAPVDADPYPLRGTPKSALGGASVRASASAASPAPLPPADAVQSVSAAPAVAATAPAAEKKTAAVPAAKLVAGAHLDASGSAPSSAPAAVAAALKPKAAPARKPYVAPKLDLSKNQGNVASMVHYGVSSRSELMGRAAGPVYNFSGGAAAKGGQVAADNATASGALKQVDAAQKAVDASDAPATDKAKIDRDLDNIRETAAAPAAP